jgi:hypothetical protein
MLELWKSSTDAVTAAFHAEQQCQQSTALPLLRGKGHSSPLRLF